MTRIFDFLLGGKKIRKFGFLVFLCRKREAELMLWKFCEEDFRFIAKTRSPSPTFSIPEKQYMREAKIRPLVSLPGAFRKILEKK